MSTAVETTVKSRYSVSRKGMGGRKEKYTASQLQEILDLAKQSNLTTACKNKNVPYVSVRAALKRKNMWPVVISASTDTTHAA